MTDLRTTQALVRTILQKPHAHEWSLQGFGMLRLYLSKTHRLHIWCSELATDGIFDSSVHDHPWDFTSTILSGQITNEIFVKDRDGNMDFREQEIICGPGGHALGAAPLVTLRRVVNETHYVGQSYSQRAHEIHRSIPSDGAISLIARHTMKSDPDRALVYWQGEKWISAEPRPATVEEVTFASARALLTLETHRC